MKKSNTEEKNGLLSLLVIASLQQAINHWKEKKDDMQYTDAWDYINVDIKRLETDLKLYTSQLDSLKVINNK